LVYLNDDLVGSESSVSTDGSVASFDRDLGQLNVGDTIWVVIDPLKTQYYDAFNNFDFSLEKLVPVADGLAALSVTTVPEPSSVVVLLAAFGCGWLGWRRRARAFMGLL
jgi:PEP-CTERM motif